MNLSLLSKLGAVVLAGCLVGCEGPEGPAGPEGADGAEGPAGADGAQGPAGEDGADGSNGAPGANGDDGEPGAPGANGDDGADGNDGADGEDGIVTTLYREGGGSDLVLESDQVPATCQTTAYVAGAGEVALMQVQFSAQSSAAATLRLIGMVLLDGGASSYASNFYTSQSVSESSYASLTTFAELPLAEGVEYVFGPSIGADPATTALTFTCHSIVTIVREEQEEE